MPIDSGSKQGTPWPLPKFHFQVNIGDDIASFAEVSSLDNESNATKYRPGNSHEFLNIKMPGVKVYSNVIMKRGIFTKGCSFWEWLNSIQSGNLKRENIVISLLDESDSPTMVWTIINAWPITITGTNLSTNEHVVAVETIEIAHEGLTIKNV